jgi:hypothetical protein
MSLPELRREFRKLQEEFLGGTVGKMKRHDIEHRMIALKAAMEVKANTPVPEPVPPKVGAPSARAVKTKEVAIDEETKVTKPVAPKEGKAHSTHYKKREKPAAEAAPKVEEKPTLKVTDEKPKKVRRVPPKVELKEEAAAEPKPERKKVVRPKPASKATAEPKTAPPAPEAEPAPVVEMKPARMPGGCRPLPEATLSFN